MGIHVKVVSEPTDTTQITFYPQGKSHNKTPITKTDEARQSFPGKPIPGGTEIDVPGDGSVTLYYPGRTWEQVCSGGFVYSIPSDPDNDSFKLPSEQGKPRLPKKISIRPRPRSREEEALTLMLDYLSEFFDQQQLPPETIESLQRQLIEPLISTVDTFTPEARQMTRERLTAPGGLLTRFGTPQQQRRIGGLNNDA